MTIAQQLAALRQLDVAELAARFEELHGAPPRIRHKTWLFQRVAWKVQEQALGGLDDETTARLATLMAEVEIPVNGARTKLARRSRNGTPSPGTTLTRQWRGQQIVVRVTDAGCEWNGVVYRSLTAVAKAITGTHWNGKLFFGITKRGKGS